MSRELRQFLEDRITDENHKFFAQGLLQENLYDLMKATGIPKSIAERLFNELTRTMLSIGADQDWSNAREFLNVDVRKIPEFSTWKVCAYSYTTFMGFGLLCYCLSRLKKRCNFVL